MYVVIIQHGWRELRFRFCDRFEALQFMVDAVAHQQEPDDGEELNFRLEVDFNGNLMEVDENETDGKENQTVGAED